MELDVGETPGENVPVGAGSWGGPEVWQGKLEKWKWMKLEFGGGVMSNLRKKDSFGVGSWVRLEGNGPGGVGSLGKGLKKLEKLRLEIGKLG